MRKIVLNRQFFFGAALGAALMGLCLVHPLVSSRNAAADMYYLRCWTMYNALHAMLQDNDMVSGRGKHYINAWTLVLSKELNNAKKRYPMHPSFLQLVYLLDKDAETHALDIPEWMREMANGLDSNILDERYLTKGNLFYE